MSDQTYKGFIAFENADKEIQQIIDTPYDCMCLYERIEGMKCVVTTVCCVNCATFKNCVEVCPASEKWVISERLCGYAHKKTVGVKNENV